MTLDPEGLSTSQGFTGILTSTDLLVLLTQTPIKCIRGDDQLKIVSAWIDAGGNRSTRNNQRLGHFPAFLKHVNLSSISSDDLVELFDKNNAVYENLQCR